MPLIDTYCGMKIHVYYGDHLPPHVNVYYNEYHMAIAVESGISLIGRLPVNQQRLIKKWIIKNSDWALNMFYRVNPTLK